MMADVDKKATKALYVRRLYEKRRAIGLCVKCGAVPEKESALCGRCRAKHATAQASRRRARSAGGVCVQCPAPVWREGASHCIGHRVMVREARREKYGRKVRHENAVSYVAERCPKLIGIKDILEPVKKKAAIVQPATKPEILNLGFLQRRAQVLGVKV